MSDKKVKNMISHKCRTGEGVMTKKIELGRWFSRQE